MLNIIFRTVIIYIVVTIAIRLMGKRQIGDMQPNELVITLLISEIAAIPLQDTNQPILSGIIAIFILVVLEISVSILAMKNFHIRKIMSGKSAVIIKNGVIDQHAMQDVRMTLLDLIELLRGKDIFRIEDVAFAVLEVNGDLSVMKKSDVETVKVSDMNISPSPAFLPLPVITDGKIVKESLTALSLERKDIDKILNSEKMNIGDVFLMTSDRNKKYTITKKEKTL